MLFYASIRLHHKDVLHPYVKHLSTNVSRRSIRHLCNTPLKSQSTFRVRRAKSEILLYSTYLERTLTISWDLQDKMKFIAFIVFATVLVLTLADALGTSTPSAPRISKIKPVTLPRTIRKRQVGERCRRRRHCRSRRCHRRRCVCRRSRHCPAGQVCIRRFLGKNRCEPSGLLHGARCKRSKQCLSGRCWLGKCSCRADAACPSGTKCCRRFLKTNSCVKPHKIFSERCDCHHECLSGFCNKQVLFGVTSGGGVTTPTGPTSKNTCA